MRGQCSECGLEFNWADLLNSDRIELPWLYEHARRSWSVHRIITTAIRTLAPWRFWSRIELHHRISFKRLTLYLLLPLILLYAASVSLGVISATAIWLPNIGATAPLTAYASSAIVQPSAATLDGSDLTITRDNVTVTIQNALNPTARPVLHETEIGPILVINEFNAGGWHVRTRRISIFNIASYWTPAVLYSPDGVEQPDTVITAHIFRDTRNLPDPWTDLVLAAIFDPIGARRTQSVGALVGALNDYPSIDPTPILMLGFLIVAVAIIISAPSEWRHARVRNSHLVRIATYSLTPVIFLYALALIAHAWTYTGFPVYMLTSQYSFDGWLVPPPWLATFATAEPSLWFLGMVAIWTPLYWWFALKRGMQLQKPFWLWLFIVIGGLLGSAAVPIAVMYPIYWLTH